MDFCEGYKWNIVGICLVNCSRDYVRGAMQVI